jgi:hypothetical protein
MKKVCDYPTLVLPSPLLTVKASEDWQYLICVCEDGWYKVFPNPETMQFEIEKLHDSYGNKVIIDEREVPDEP